MTSYKLEIRDYKRAAWILAGLIGLAGLLQGEEVVTTAGEHYSGKVTVGPHALVCETPTVKRTIALGLITGIGLTGPETAEFEIMRKKGAGLDAGTYVKLGEWLKGKHQLGKAQEYFTKAIEVEKDNESARRELGFAKEGGEWKYSPKVHQAAMYGWVGVEAVGFHLNMAKKLAELKENGTTELELRRVLQADPYNKEALDMIRPIVAARPCRNKYRLPFAGTWVTTSGPEGPHGTRAVMMNAWDFRKVDEQGKIGSGDPEKLESYYTWDAPVYACADGEVYQIIDEFADNPVGTIAPIEEGNRVLIRHANGERSVIGHFKKGSVKVKVGQKVKQGAILGVLGNSGRSATPHLHFAVFDDDGISLPITFWDYSVAEKGERTHVDKGLMELGKIYEEKAK